MPMNELAAYKRALSSALDCPPHIRHERIAHMERMVEDFLLGKPDATWPEVLAFLGDPQELAEAMLEGADWEAIILYRKRKKFWRIFAVSTVLVMCICLSVLLSYILHMRAKAPPVTATETLIIYEPIEEQEVTG